jgi:hypothetical protein
MEEIKILLDKTDISNRLYVLVLDGKTHCYLHVKISYAEELVNRNYKNILNAFMIFRIDCCGAFNEAKSNERFRKNYRSFKDTSFLWKISPKEVTDVYELVFTDFKKLKPKILNFITCYPQENKSENNNEPEFENSEAIYDQNNIFQPETENSGIITNRDELSDRIDCLTSQSRYDEPEFDNSEIILDQINNNTNDLNSQPETIQFGNTEVSGNLYNLSDEYLIPQYEPEFDNSATALVCNNNTNDLISETNHFENSGFMVDNIDYFAPQLQYDNAYNNLGMRYFKKKLLCTLDNI